MTLAFKDFSYFIRCKRIKSASERYEVNHEEVFVVGYEFGSREKSLMEGPLSNDIGIKFIHLISYAVFGNNSETKTCNNLMNSVVYFGIRMIRSAG